MRDYFTDQFATKGKNTGEQNHFYGKHHSKETKALLSSRDVSHLKTQEFREKMSEVTRGKSNPMYGRNFYDIWVAKYGLDEANRLLNEKRRKNSAASTGANNPMFGKPTPGGSGQGWKGWFRERHFRSLHELAFMITTDKDGGKYVSAESSDLSIPYLDWRGVERTYRADFVLDNKYMIECKPQKMWSTPSVVSKKLAAEIFCAGVGLEYRLVDYGIPSTEEIKTFRQSKELIFESKYETMFQEKYLHD